MSLVPVPWQPHLFLTPDTLDLLIAAGNERGRPLHIVGNDGAWRPYALQKYYYDGYKAGRPGFNPASDPDKGQRSHMRGAAFDLINTDAATQAACRAVGLIRDNKEAWHWNNPRWASMPIIKTNTGTAGNGGTVIQPEEENMPITDADAQTFAKTQIILPGPWKQASIADTLAGTRARAEDTYLQVNALTAAVSALAGAQGIPANQLATIVANAVETKLADDFAAVKQALTGATSGLSDDVFQALAVAVADEQDRRTRTRLGA